MKVLGIPKSTIYRKIHELDLKLNVTTNNRSILAINMYSRKIKFVLEHLENMTNMIGAMEEIFMSDFKNTSTNTFLNNEEKKIKVFQHYCGNDIKCECCGEKIVKLLTLDHKNEDGKIHRMALDGENIYDYLLRVNFNTHYELRVFCYNCNLGSYRNKGVCPHITLK